MRAASWAWLAGFGLLPYALYGCAGAPPPPAPPPLASAGVVVVVVLLPDHAGQVGRITLSSPQGTQELSRPGEGIRVSTADPALSAPVAMDSAYISRVFGAALAAQPGPPARFVLYFEGDSDRLTAESQRRLAEVARTVVERRALAVSIVGHTDTVGTREYNFQLGLRRARRVQEAIRTQAVDQSIVRVESHGKNDPLVPTGDNVPEPRNRRVEVIIR
jgi:outer membrane protein OmpA-like peptidoglycan-associated protein